MRVCTQFALILRRFSADRRGSIAIVAAAFAASLMALAALGIDSGKVLLDRRKAQAATDLAAIAAVSDLGNASKAAAATLARNKFGSENPASVELGVYTASSALAPGSRFQPSTAASANAARVTMRSQSALTFGAALLGTKNFTVTTQAIATQSAFATFAIGSRLAQINGGLLNSVLGALLGANINLSVNDYNALLTANIDLFDVMNALATRLSLSAATYDSLLASQVKVTDVLAAMIDSLRTAGNSAAASALAGLSQDVAGSTSKIALRAVLDAGPYNAMSPGQKPRVGVNSGVLDMVTALAQIANGQRQVQTTLGISIPGLTGATLALVIGERPIETSWITVGPVGASVYTASTRLLLTATVNGAGAIAAVTVPVYIELASARAQLTNLSCDFAGGTASMTTLAVTPSLIDAWIGAVSVSDFVNFTSKPSPSPAMLVNLPLVQVSGRSHVAVSNMSATPVTFTMADISARRKKTVGTSNYTSTLLSTLLGTTQLGVNVAGLGLGLSTGAVSGLVSGILTTAVSPLDQLLSTVLTTLGVGLGQADVWVTGLRCDGAVLVN